MMTFTKKLIETILDKDFIDNFYPSTVLSRDFLVQISLLKKLQALAEKAQEEIIEKEAV